jgi:hypothetical protein
MAWNFVGTTNINYINKNSNNSAIGGGMYGRTDADGTQVQYRANKSGGYDAFIQGGEAATDTAKSIGGGGMGGLDMLSGSMSIASGVLQIADAFNGSKAADKNYKLQMEGLKAYDEAMEQIKLQSIQQQNYMGEALLSGIDDIKYSAVVRGVSASDGSVQNNIERSGGAYGRDIKKTKDMEQNETNRLQKEKDDLAHQYNEQRRAAKKQSVINGAMGVVNVAKGVGQMAIGMA